MNSKTSYDGWNDLYNGKSVEHSMPSGEDAASRIINPSKAHPGIVNGSQRLYIPVYQRYFTKSDANKVIENQLVKRSEINKL